MELTAASPPARTVSPSTAVIGSNVVSIGIAPAEKPIWPRPVPATSTKEMQRRLGAAIRLRRRVVDITLTDLAGVCGVSFQQVQKYESGTCSISAAQLWNIACALDIPISHLYDRAAATEVA
jgi:DNA-binding XRE family transcriptional regulator